MESKAYLLHALSPLHAGTGHAADVIDLPIARMKATGIPIVPGSSVKGVLRDARKEPPQGHNQRDEHRSRWLATFGPETANAADHAGALVVGDARLLALPVEGRRRIETPPGDYYRALFGAPDVDNDASAGLVVFHDALYVPGSAAGDKPFAVDVLTVHQRSYYGQAEGQTQPGKRWPNDYDGPNPVGFISVRPGVKLLLAVDGHPGWTALALDLPTEALRTWGAGGKTSAGYGRSD